MNGTQSSKDAAMAQKSAQKSGAQAMAPASNGGTVIGKRKKDALKPIITNELIRYVVLAAIRIVLRFS